MAIISHTRRLDGILFESKNEQDATTLRVYSGPVKPRQPMQGERVRCQVISSGHLHLKRLEAVGGTKIEAYAPRFLVGVGVAIPSPMEAKVAVGGSPTRIHLALIKHSEKRTPFADLLDAVPNSPDVSSRAKLWGYG